MKPINLDLINKLIIKYLLLLLGLIGTSPSCFFAQSNPEIYGGEAIEISEAPYQVSLEYSGNNWDHWCGGTILNCEWILTAAHCVYGKRDPDDWIVHAGSTDQTNNSAGQRVHVDQIIIHSLYIDRDAAPYDIALMHLSEPLIFNTNVRPIEYARPENTSLDDIAPGKSVFLSGWGRLENSGNLSTDELRGATLSIISNDDANDYIERPVNGLCGSIHYVDNTMISYESMQIVAGKGDSGGPSVISLEDGSQRVIGVTSWRPCALRSGVLLTICANVRELYKFIDDNIAKVCCDGELPNIEISTNTVYSTDRPINSDIIVKSGAQLTVKGKLFLGQNIGIIVERGAKLHIDGGTLTRCSSTHDWRGINVEGYVDRAQPDAFAAPDPNKAGIVLMTNGAKIEWARYAISTSKLDQIWNRDYWGGLVVATSNSRFRNNKRAVEFMKYPENNNGILTNNSYFEDCVFEEYLVDAFDGTFGVTIWSTDGIYFEGCTFQNLDRQGITIFDAHADITLRNKFHNLTRGIESFATHPYTSSTNIGIKGTPFQYINEFKHNDYDIIGLASDERDGIKVFNNKFEGDNLSRNSIFFTGPTYHDVRYNAFASYPWGFMGRETGSYRNFIKCNDFWNVSAGISYWGNNRFTQFIKNDFNCSTDIFLRHWEKDGQVYNLQGGGRGADNCFTLGTNDIFAHPSLVRKFKYYTTDRYGDPLTSCLVPDDNLSDGGINNYTIHLAEVEQGCNNSIPPQNSDTSCNFIIQDWTDILALVNQRNSDLILEPNNESFITALAEAEYLKEEIFRCLLNDDIENGDLNSAYILLDQEGSTNAQRLKFGIMLNHDDYLGATNVLNQLPESTTDDVYFKQVQEINLLRMMNTGEFVLSQDQEVLLTDIAMSITSSSAYARSLLALLLDIRLPYEVFDLPNNGQNLLRQMKVYKRQDDFSIINNPVRDILKISVNQTSGVPLTMEMYNINGLSVYVSDISAESGEISIDMSSLPQGMYFVQIRGLNNLDIFTKKIIKQ